MKRINGMDARKTHCQSTLRAWLAAAIVLPGVLLATGCQSDYAGQTLPSPWYLTDDVQYYPPGPGFKLAREAAAMQQQKAADVSQPQGGF